MASNDTALGAPEGSLDSLNATVNGTATAPSAFSALQDLDFLLLELKLVFSAIGIIYLGCHASLRRPPSASPTKRRKPGQKKDDDEDDRFAQGLEPSDAIMFPLLAAAMLVGLYYLIQWLKDPAILNKILRWYMATVSIASVLTLYAHGMDFVTSLLFPRFWRGRDGSLRKADQKNRSVIICDDVGNPIKGVALEANPLPGPLGWVARSERGRKVVWELRGLLTRHWVLKFFVHGVGEEKSKIKFAHMMALLLSLGTALIYFSTTSPFLSNMLGYGMCYGSFLLLSPTDLLTSTLVLVGLFVYDIVMVFYTPYMITVATTLEVPIKLTFEAAARKSILGLGDIVIPGMVMSWALRFDLWMHYLRRVKYESTDLKILEKDATSGEVLTRSDTKHKQVKARYVEVKGTWGDRLWSRGSLFLSAPQRLPFELAASRFPKTYFYASVVGYLLGMLATLAMLLVYKRGQPALLYLVPGVLGSLFATGLVRGEMKLLWKYTEDGSLDVEDVVVDLDANGKVVKEIGKLKKGVVDTTKDKKDKSKDKDGAKKDEKDSEKEKEKKKKDDEEKATKTKKGHKVFLLSLDAPPEDDEEAQAEVEAKVSET